MLTINDCKTVTITPPDWQIIAMSFAMRIAAARAHLQYAEDNGMNGVYWGKVELDMAAADIRLISAPMMVFHPAKAVTP